MERTHTLDRWLYRGRRPNRLARLVNGASARLAAAGIGPAQLVMLEVTGRRTGKTISFPVVVADYQCERYVPAGALLFQITGQQLPVAATAGSWVVWRPCSAGTSLRPPSCWP